MSSHTARIYWNHRDDGFLRGQYSRAHTWTFDGAVTVPASSSPEVVPIPYSDPAAVDPEEAFVASIASCHMLWFLSLAAKAGFIVTEYEDAAVGVMATDENGRVWVSAVTLKPKIVYGGERLPSPADVAQLHHAAHESCFIANSVRTVITVQPSH